MNNVNQKEVKSILTNDQGKGEIQKHQKTISYWQYQQGSYGGTDLLKDYFSKYTSEKNKPLIESVSVGRGTMEVDSNVKSGS